MALHTSRRVVISVSSALCLMVLLNLGLLAWSQPTVQAADPAQLLYVSGSSLMLVNADGSNARKIGDGNNASWSPDGSKIAFSNSNEVYVINADGSGLKKVSDQQGSPRWSPDSLRLLISADKSLVAVNADGSGSKTISTQTLDYTGGYWSLDGKQILFAVNTSPETPIGELPTNYFRRDLYTANADGSNPSKRFTFYGTLQGYWLDGKRIVYTDMKEDDLPGMCTSGKLAISNLDGSGKQVFGGDYCYGIQISFSPNGDKALIDGSILVSIADPVGTARTLSNLGVWSNNPGKVITLTPSGEANDSRTFKLEEVDLTTNASRQILQTSPLQIFHGEGPTVFGLQVESSGYAVFKHMRGNIYIANLNNGQLRSFSGDNVVGWRPRGSSSAPTTYGSILPDFFNVWKQSDLAIATGQSNKSWLWGPDATATKTEDYKEAKGGKRQVQYFDKARMEINNPDGDKSSAYFVTNGLLPKELIGGYIQTGDSTKQSKAPAEVNVAGDPNGSITYAKLAGVITLEPGKNTATDRTGQKVTASLDRTGKVSDGTALAGVTLAQFLPETGHNLPNVFVDYFKTLPQDWLFVMGYPISEPYQTEITLAGKPTQVLIQVFERRVLTYTPSNADPFKVEQGNVGQHYYQWRYGN